MKLPNYMAGSWQLGVGEGVALSDPVTGETLAIADSQGMDLETAMTHAREQGNSALQRLTYRQRAELLAGIAEVLSQNKSTYYEIAQKNYGATAGDAGFDVDGAIFTLKAFARAGKALGDHVKLIEGERVPLDKSGVFQGQHFLKPLAGMALFINAFNFPSWGLWEKAAPALLAGVPFLVKPATPTAWLTQRMVSDVVEAGILPQGAISIVCGPARDLLDHLQSNDVVSFTGSAETAAMIRNHPKVLTQSVRINIEADSLNSAIIAPDALPGSETFGLAVREIVREMTVKAGQKCTAIRRIFVPAAQADALTQALVEKLQKVVAGDPRNESVRMGPLMNAEQRRGVQDGLQQLTQEARVVPGLGESFVPLDAESDSAFMAPTLLRCDLGLDARVAHAVELFGEVLDRPLVRGVGRVAAVDGHVLPGLVVFDHQAQQPQRSLSVQQEVLVHDEERSDVHILFELAHDLEQLVARLVEVNTLALPAEHRRGRTEITPHGTSDGWNQGGGHVAWAQPDGCSVIGHDPRFAFSDGDERQRSLGHDP